MVVARRMDFIEIAVGRTHQALQILESFRGLIVDGHKVRQFESKVDLAVRVHGVRFMEGALQERGDVARGGCDARRVGHEKRYLDRLGRVVAGVATHQNGEYHRSQNSEGPVAHGAGSFWVDGTRCTWYRRLLTAVSGYLLRGTRSKLTSRTACSSPLQCSGLVA